METKIETKRVKLNDLKGNPDNAKEHDIEMLKTSFKDFGYIDAVVVDENNMILHGHGRVETLRGLGENEVDVIVKRGLSEEQKKNFILTQNTYKTGGWDTKKLNEFFPKDVLKKWGFSINDNKNTAGSEVFTTEILEENNYIVFVFNNVIDWGLVKSLFNLESVQSLDSKEDYKREGVGRVLDGKLLIRKLQNENSDTKLQETK